MADNNEQRQSDTEAADGKTSIFDLFEPAPERGPNSFGKIPVIKEDDIDLTEGASSAERKAAADVEAAGLQHWTAPPTGQVPAVLTTEKDDSGLWADVKGPSWHGDDPSWAGPDLADVFADTDSVSLDGSDDEYDDDEDDDYGEDGYEAVAVQRPLTAPRSAAPGSSPAPAPEDLGDETQIAPPPPARSIRQERPAADSRPDPTRRPQPQPQPQARPQPTPRHEPRPPSQGRPAPQPQAPPPRLAPPDRSLPAPGSIAPGRPGRLAPASAFLDETELPPAEPRQSLRGPLADARDTAPPTRFDAESAPSIDDIEFADEEYYEDELDQALGLSPAGGRDLPKAIGVGLGLAAVVLIAMWFGPYTTLLLVVVLALLAVLELYNAMRMAGLRPATLLGIVGTVAAPAAAYYRGDAAFPLIVALAVVFGTLWYLVGADTERPVLNLSLTVLGIFWVGGLAAFGALMLRLDGGIQLLLATIIITVASDTMAYVGGKAYGKRPFHHASPNKTWEGTITGFAGALFAGFAIGVTDMGTLWDGNLIPALALGAVVGALAPIGDLAESVVKRDLGVKDMGTLLPGHGGVLDRLDGLLFALPGAYYLALVYGLI